MEGTDRFIISPAGASWFGNTAGRGGGTGLVKVVNCFYDGFAFEVLFLVEYDFFFIFLFLCSGGWGKIKF